MLHFYLVLINVKKLRFRHELTANETSKTVIFAVLDVSFAVDSCLNRIYICSFNTFLQL